MSKWRENNEEFTDTNEDDSLAMLSHFRNLIRKPAGTTRPDGIIFTLRELMGISKGNCLTIEAGATTLHKYHQ